MPNLYTEEVFVNVTEGYRFGESGVIESFTDDKGKLFRRLRECYGRCVGKIYIDREGQSPQAIGWVFQGRDKYDDSKETYLREVWVTLHEQKPTVTRENHYATLGEGR